MRLVTVYFLLIILSPLNIYAVDIVEIDQLALLEQSSDESSLSIDLGHDKRRGVEARAQLELQEMSETSDPLPESMLLFTLSVSFADIATGKILLDGQVAARAFEADNRVLKTIRLEPQELFWTGSLALSRDEETMIKVGSQLADGKKRIYRFFFGRPVVPAIEDLSPPQQL